MSWSKSLCPDSERISVPQHDEVCQARRWSSPFEVKNIYTTARRQGISRDKKIWILKGIVRSFLS